MFQQLKTLVIKEILVMWRDKKSRLSLIMPPLIQLLVFAYAATMDLKSLSVGYLNYDKGGQGYELVQRLQGAPYVKKLKPFTTPQELKKAFDRQDIFIAVVIPQNFTRLIKGGRQAPLQIITDGRNSNVAQISQGYVERIVATYNQDILMTSQKQGGAENGGGGEAYPQLIPEFRAWFNPNLDYIFYNVPCLLAILSMVLCLSVTALSIAREREIGTLDQLLVSPLSIPQMLLGKTLPALLIAGTESLVITILAMCVFDVPFQGSFLLLYGCLLIFIVANLGVGILISIISKTQQQASLGTFVFMCPAMLLSGYGAPVENMTTFLKPLSYCLPITHFFIIVKAIFLKNADFFQVLSHILPIFIFAVCSYSLAIWMFKKKVVS